MLRCIGRVTLNCPFGTSDQIGCLGPIFNTEEECEAAILAAWNPDCSVTLIRSCLVQSCECSTSPDKGQFMEDCCGPRPCCTTTGGCRMATYSSCLSTWGSQTYANYFNRATNCDDPSVTCRQPKKCCHCDWCCAIKTGYTEEQCTDAGGAVRNGTCVDGQPCDNAPCKPCNLEGFSLAMNRAGNGFSVAGGYQPIANIKAIDTTANNEPNRVMHASLAASSGGNSYAAQSCNIYNRFIGGNRHSNTVSSDATLRRAVSECSLAATGGYGYQFICPYREPCSELPTNCTQAAA